MTSNDTNNAGTRVIEDQPRQHADETIFDPTSEMFQAPKETPKNKKGYWKKRFLIWLVIILMIGCGVGILYWLVKVKHVKVTVLADNRGNRSTIKPEANGEQRESGLSAEAINIARAAVGNDPIPQVGPAANPSPSSSGNTSELPHATDLTLGPALDSRVADAELAALSTSNVSPPRPEKQPAAEATVQSRANAAQTIFVGDDLTTPPTRATETTTAKPRHELPVKPVAPSKKTAVLPPFGTMLPVRTQNVLLTIRNNSYARLELTRTMSGEGWSLPKGTVIIGRTSGSELDRAFVSVLGYIDPKDNRFVIMKGEVLGSDGGAGLPGKGGNGSRITADRNRFKQTLAKIGASSLQIAGTMAGALTGRLPVFINNTADEVIDPTVNRSRPRNPRSFVKVNAGEFGYVMVADLPLEMDSIDAPGAEELNIAATSLTDIEVMELILFGTPDEVHAALPMMNPEQRAMVGRTIKTHGDKP